MFLHSSRSGQANFCSHGYASSVFIVASLFHLCRVISDSWMIKCGRFSQTSPMDALLLLRSFPPPLKPPRLIPRLLAVRLPPCGGLCVTHALLHRHLASPLQFDQADPNAILRATALICRYPRAKMTGHLEVFVIIDNTDLLFLALIDRARTQ